MAAIAETGSDPWNSAPADWNSLPLSDMVATDAPICYGIVQVGKYVSNGIPVLAIKNLNTDYRSRIHRCRPDIEAPYARSRVQPHDVVISIKGTVGRIGIVPDFFVGNISRDLARLRFSQSFLPQLCFHVLRSQDTQRRLTAAVVGTTRMELSIAVLRRLRVLVPLLAKEQHAIAQALSDIDDLIQSLERLIAKKRGLKQAAMQRLLTGQTRLPGFSGEWQQTQVREVISAYFSGPSPTCEERNISGHAEWGVLKTTAATKKDGWNWRAHKTLPTAFWNKPNLELRVGDVIVTKAGPRHRVGVTAWIDYVPERIIPSGKMIALRPDRERVVPLMLAAAIDSKKSQKFLDDRTTGMAESQVNFENDALLQAPIVIPSMNEQRAIAEVLSDMDAEINALDARLTKTRDLKQGMMQELLTGRTRLV